MIVLDASVVVPALVDQAGSGALAREVLTADSDLHAPHLLDVEVASVLRRHARCGLLAPARAAAALTDLDDLALTRYPHVGLLPRIWQLRENLSAYDATYAALAEYAVGNPAHRRSRSGACAGPALPGSTAELTCVRSLGVSGR